LRLKMSISRRLLPKRVNLRLTAFFHQLRKTDGFDVEQFHIRGGSEKSPPGNYGKEDQTTVAAFLPWRGS